MTTTPHPRAAERAPLLDAWRKAPDDPAVQAVYADFLQENGSGLFLVMQLGVYRHSVIGLFSRLEWALAAGRDAVRQEHDHHHDAEVVEVPVDRGGFVPATDPRLGMYGAPAATNEWPVCRLGWEPDPGAKSVAEKAARGRVVCKVE